jgi:branched-chain amino acid transport system permease protein
VVWLVHRITSGDYGRAIQAMRDDEEAFTSLGRNAMAIKITIFAVGSGLAGLAGALYAHYFEFLTPEQFGITQSALILTMVVVGGMGTTAGPVIGALLLVALPQAITFLNMPPSIMAPLQGMIYTGLVLLFLYLRPAGLLGKRARQ